MQTLWISETRRNLICVDSYDNGILTGWLYSPQQEGLRFLSLTQLLLHMEALLDESRSPQSYTIPRRFSEVTDPGWQVGSVPLHRKGKVATFELNVLFRQHTSWQGMLRWQEKGLEESFRSVLELVLLMDSALRAA